MGKEPMSGGGTTSEPGESSPLDLDAELDLGTEEFESESEPGSENDLPSPDDLGLDLTDNTAVDEE